MPDLSLHPVVSALLTTPSFRLLQQSLPSPGEVRTVGGTLGSLDLGIIATLALSAPQRRWLVVAQTPSEAAQACSDLEALLGSGSPAHFPQRESLTPDGEEHHLEISGARVEAIEALMAGRASILVTTYRGLQEVAPIPDELATLRFTVRVGDQIGHDSLVSALEERGLERVPMVEAVGQYAVRGGIVDFFSFGAAGPVRVELWGDDIESIRLFDILDQRSTESAEEVHVLPVNFRGSGSSEATSRKSLLELIAHDTTLFTLGPDAWEAQSHRAWDHAQLVYREAVSHGNPATPPSNLFLDPDTFAKRLEAFPRVSLIDEPIGAPVFGTRPPPAIDRDTKRLKSFLVSASAEQAKTLILCDNDGQAHRLEELIGNHRGVLPSGTQVAVGSIGGGFRLEEAVPPLNVLTDHEIFKRGRRLRRGRRFRGAASIESLAQLSPGDYVVHMDHGIGRFEGLEHITVGGEEIEALVITYEGNERLRVPVYRLDQVERWVTGDPDAHPKSLHKLGGKRWKTLKNKTEAAIEAMTAELLELYASRKAAVGTAFSPDTRWQAEMESSFLYDDTPDQRSASEDVKQDMESSGVMDRLVCGDVGYGKTEVAVRAAFKAVQDEKQVAVLAPTTILAEQHVKTFSERIADYPFRVGALSRFRSAKDQKELLADLATGKVDIVVGTHRLLSDDVAFKDLGLLIVDEEQRFGVKHKERLKRLKTSVDVLTLSATPIPRTLYLSLSGIRDLSLIRTPPRDRMPVITHALPWSDGLIAEAIHTELDRGGQVFFLHNRVETIDTIAARIADLVPDAEIRVAHGQMGAKDLDRAMTDFVGGTAQVLVCSSIIENGLDVPNANTLIVNRADRFGLSQLYQIRGRVGRSDRRAYCYLMVPDGVSEDAEKRLKILEHYTELGSGYQIAMKDLELRGAGNLLGEDQSGFAHAVGLDTYLRMLEKTVKRLKEGPSAEEFPRPEVTMEMGAFLPDDYVNDEHQKLAIYRKLAKVTKRLELVELEAELKDRFGPLPVEAKRLFDQAALGLVGKKLGVDRILLRPKRARVNFRPDVVPKLSALEGELADQPVQVEIRRLSPLSLVLEVTDPPVLGAMVVKVLEALSRDLPTRTGVAR